MSGIVEGAASVTATQFCRRSRRVGRADYPQTRRTCHLAESGKDRLPPPFLNRLIEAFPGGIAYLNQDLIFTFCNDIQASYFGFAADQVLGRRLHDVAPDNEDFWREIERVATTGIALPQTALSVAWADRPAEGEHHYLVSYSADIGATAEGLFMTALEITASILHEREVESVLRERNRVLKETVKEGDILVGIISHELRTPVTTIFGNAHMLLRRLEDIDAESRTRAVTDIREEAERLSGLVENMFFSRVRESTHPPSRS